MSISLRSKRPVNLFISYHRLSPSVILVLFIIAANSAFAQVLRIPLDTLTVQDDELNGIHILTSKPAQPVVLPPGDNQTKRFITEFYSRKMTPNPDFVIMVESKKGGDLLSIDKNLNADLTDDGPPIFFPFKRDTITFDIVSPKDPLQRTKILLARSLDYKRVTRDLPDSLKRRSIDRSGNLNPKFASFVGMSHGQADFTGKAGTYYFADRVSVRRGTVTLKGRIYTLGLLDYSNNGLFDDDDDVLVMDKDGNRRLCFADSRSCTYKFNDVLLLGDEHYKIHRVDNYGKWIEIERTDADSTTFFRDFFDSLITSGARRVKLSPSFWTHKFLSLEGDTLILSSLKGTYLLLNFWGEWCRPCIEEIPELVRARKAYPDSLVRFVGFVKIEDKVKAMKMIKESDMTWKQVPITEEIVKLFKLHGYPSNILILPNGEECVTIHQVNPVFFKAYFKN